MTLVQFVIIIPIVEILFYNTRRKTHFYYGALLLNLCYGMIMNVDGKGEYLGKGEEQFFLKKIKYIPRNESCAYSINYPK